MIFTETDLKGAYTIEPEKLADDRGFFARTWCQQEFSDRGLDPNLVQASISFNHQRGTLRGMHLQLPPAAEVKLVRCTRGAIYDVIVDLRSNSPTYWQWTGIKLTADNRTALYIPQGFAHGFQTLEDNTEVFYQISEFYNPELARGLRWNDPTIKIDWPIAVTTISDRDLTYPDYTPESFSMSLPIDKPLDIQSTSVDVDLVLANSNSPPEESIELPDPPQIGLEMHQLISKLYPICRSITGDGVRKTLHLLQQFIALEQHEVPTGTAVFDWTVPKEWNINDAYLIDPQGKKVIDFQKSNLHVLNYSIPIDTKLPLSELKEHLFSLPDRPDWIPYRTSYYQENWGFCLSHHALEQLQDGEYEVYINSSLAPGSLTYGEYYIPGATSDEILFSCHVCHPSLCNDNLSGIGLATFLAKQLEAKSHRYSYRFIFVPGTIGSITWLSLNRDRVDRIKHGLVISGVGDAGRLTYKKSRRGDAEVDRAVAHVLQHSGQEYAIEDFLPYGYDERQYCSPGFNLPVGSLTRTPFDRYPEYHTSADNLDFIQPTALADSLEQYLAVIDILENNCTYLNTNPYCEPQLGKRGLYGNFGGKKSTKIREMAMLWVLNLADGSNSLLEIADRANLPFSVLHEAAVDLVASGLLSEIKPILNK